MLTAFQCQNSVYFIALECKSNAFNGPSVQHELMRTA